MKATVNKLNARILKLEEALKCALWIRDTIQERGSYGSSFEEWEEIESVVRNARESVPRVKRYVTFTTEVNGEKLHRCLSYWQFMFRFVVLPSALVTASIVLVRFFFAGGK